MTHMIRLEKMSHMSRLEKMSHIYESYESYESYDALSPWVIFRKRALQLVVVLISCDACVHGWHNMVRRVSVQGGVESQDALSSWVIFRKKPCH